MKMINGIVFDMDGVLTETSEQHFEAWQKLANRLGFEIGEEIKDKVRGISRLDSLDIILKAGGISNNYTDEKKIALATEKNEIYLSLIGAFTPANLNQDAEVLLEMLKKKGYKIALASASKNAPFLLKAMCIEKYFDAVVDPSKIEKGKPAPDIFIKAAEMLHLSPQLCIGVEDAFAGIESIKSAGMKPIGNGSRTILTNCEYVYSDLHEAKIAYFDTLSEIIG